MHRRLPARFCSSSSHRLAPGSKPTSVTRSKQSASRSRRDGPSNESWPHNSRHAPKRALYVAEAQGRFATAPLDATTASRKSRRLGSVREPRGARGDGDDGEGSGGGDSARGSARGGARGSGRGGGGGGAKGFVLW